VRARITRGQGDKHKTVESDMRGARDEDANWGGVSSSFKIRLKLIKGSGARENEGQEHVGLSLSYTNASGTKGIHHYRLHP